MAVQFLDDTGTPLLGGISVSITQGGSLVGSGTTDDTGTVAVSVTNGIAYVASFSGPGAPSTNQTFYGGTSGYLTDESGDPITTEGGDPLLVQTPGTTIVTCDSFTDPTLVSIAVTPASSNVVAEGTVQYTATATYSDSSTRDLTDFVTWTATGGTIDATGLYTAGDTEGSYTITATYDSVSGDTPVIIGEPLGAIITQAVIETLAPTPHPGLRVTQLVSEAIFKTTGARGRLTQMVAEVITQRIPPRARVSQMVIEMIQPVTYTLAVYPSNATISTTGRQRYVGVKTGSNGLSQVVPCTWATDDPHGSIDETGLYIPTAESPGSHTVTATEIS
jgi:hypothetical protein